MDPASILSLISTAGTIAAQITKTIKDLSDLRATYIESNVRIKLLIKELSTVKSSLTQINDWAHFLDETHDQVDLKDALQVALDGVELAMEALAEEVRALVPDVTPASHLQMGFRAKTKYAWNEQNMKEHENRLRAQISALNLLLQAAQLPSRPEQAEFLKAPQSRQIIQKVADDTITLRNTMSVAGSQRGPPTILSHEDSTIDDRVFDWDNDIVNAAAYRRALHHNASKQRMADKPPPQPHGGSVQIHMGSEDGRDELTPSPSPTPSRDSRPLPYENSVVSEPVNMLYASGSKTYVPLSSRSDVAPERHRPLADRLRPSELGKKTFWSSLTPKRSSRNVNSLTPPGSSPGTPASSSAPGSHRGRRGFENSSHASIDFGSENGLSAPSIVRAAQAGSVMEVEMLLNNGAEVESVHQQSGRTALAVASHCGNERVVQLLLQYNANVNARDASSLCPLHLAAMRGHYRVIALLLQEHVRIDEPGPNDETPLRIAAEKGYMECVELLLQTRAKVNTRDRKRRRTPLHLAAANGDEAMAELLIRHGAHMEAKDGELMTPLHEACEAGKDRIVTLLLNKKASPETLGRRGMTPIVCAAAAGQVQIMEVLLKKKASLKHQAEGDMTALHWAAYEGHDEAVDYLLQKKAPPHVANKDGRTALHLSIMAGHFAVVELLLRKGAAVEAQCRAMKRPIHYACQQSSTEIVQLLLGHHANPEIESSGHRPLHYAAAKGMTSLVSILLSRGVDIEARDADGERALGLASRMGHLAIVQMLLDRGSRIRSKFAKGPSHEDSPLCLAARGGHLAVVQQLVGRGTSVLQKDEQNWNALQYASHYAHPSVVEFLLAKGATVSGNPSSGWGFDITARRIGFADEVLREDDRKARVLKLLIDAEAKEQKSQEEASTASSQPYPTPARSPMGSPAELAENPAHQQQLSPEPRTTTTTRPSELDTRLRSPSSATTSRNGAADTGESRSAYPASGHIANSFGFDPFPAQQQQQQRVSSEDANPAPRSVVQIGPDGMWRLNPTTPQAATDGAAATSIYEIGS
ncbi:MAG: hypothetical protein LQ344_000723 [Seirophora lacunosa]|nr:MAG: hypothetical protein LQ344_000723 [Seirophora lacunosa]